MGADRTAALVRKKEFSMPPVSVDEAIAALELIDHPFYVFRNKVRAQHCIDNNALHLPTIPCGTLTFCDRIPTRSIWSTNGIPVAWDTSRRRVATRQENELLLSEYVTPQGADNDRICVSRLQGVQVQQRQDVDSAINTGSGIVYV